MMKFLTTALGGLTVLTVTGFATPPGQAMLGLHPAQTATPVSVIADPGPIKVAAPAAAPVSAAPAAPAVTAPHPAVAAPAAQPVRAAPAARPVAPASAVPAQAAPAANPMGGAGAIANILLNLPQVLNQTRVGPDGNGGWIPPGQRTRQDRKHHDGEGDPQNGDFEH